MSSPGSYVNETDTFGSHSKLYVRRFGISKSAGTFEFPVFLDNFSDSFSSEWEKQSVFGRSDPMQFYGGTQRTISAEFSLVAANVLQAQTNLENVNKMAKILYPRYDDGAIVSTPIIGIKYENFIREGSGYLMGTIGTLSVIPDFQNGVFGRQDYLRATDEAVLRQAGASPFPDSLEVYPKIIRLSFDFTPLHRGTLGWNASSFIGHDSRGFPYTNEGESVQDFTGGQAFEAVLDAEETIKNIQKEEVEARIKAVAETNGNPNSVPSGGRTPVVPPGSPESLALNQAQISMNQQLDEGIFKLYDDIIVAEGLRDDPRASKESAQTYQSLINKYRQQALELERLKAK